MPEFKSYMPIKADFDEFMNSYLGHMPVSEEQRKFFEMIFFAGATSAYNVLVNKPLMQGVVLDELADHSDRFARGEKVA